MVEFEILTEADLRKMPGRESYLGMVEFIDSLESGDDLPVVPLTLYQASVSMADWTATYPDAEVVTK